MNLAPSVILMLALLPAAVPAPTEPIDVVSDSLRPRPFVSPTVAAAAVELAKDLAPAIVAKGVTQLRVLPDDRLPQAAVDAFIKTLDLRGVEAGVDRRWRWGKGRSDAVRLFVDGSVLKAECSKDIGARAVQPFKNQPWVVRADAVMDSTGAAVMGERPGDKQDVAICVGRSDPCATLREAKADAGARLEAAVALAVWRQLGKGRGPKSVSDLHIPRRVLPAPVVEFAQKLDSSVGPMHRVYLMARLSPSDVGRLQRYVEARHLSGPAAYFLKAGGLVATTLLVLLACAIAHTRRPACSPWPVRLAGLAAWGALATAFLLAS